MNTIFFKTHIHQFLVSVAALTVCAMFIVSSACAQSPMAETTIRNEFEQYRKQALREKIYVHTDKDTYISREILWFRIYYVDAFTLTPTSLSKICYVELLDRNNLPVLQEKISLKPGEDNGSLVLPVSVPTGVYKFRAYTNWMKNSGPEYFFEKSIRIINLQGTQTDTLAVKSKHYDIQFFPEGGHLVQNMLAKVGFRVTDAYGKGQNFDGVLLNAAGDSILKFHPLHFGLGNFSFTPAAGQTYHATIRLSNGETINKDLPEVSKDGYVMSLSKTADGSLTVQVRTSMQADNTDLYLFIHGNRLSLPVRKGQIANHVSEFLVKPEELESGISSFTVFNAGAEPVCERIYFKYPEKSLSINSTLNTEYATRKKVDIDLTAINQFSQPQTSDMSMAVYRIDPMQPVDGSDIRWYCYLTADLGPVESPAYYFSDEGKANPEDMENLLLTHGWRQYNWSDLVSQKKPLPLYTPEYNGHIVYGKVTNKSGEPMARVDAFISVPSTRTQFRTTSSDADGNLKFELTDFYGSQEIIVQVGPKEDSTLHIDIANPFFPKYSSWSLPEFIMPAKNSPELLDLAIHEQVQHIYDGPKLNRFSLQSIDTNTFYVQPDKKYMLDDYTRFLTMEEVLREYVSTVNVTKRKEKFHLYALDEPHRLFFEEEPLILIDGVPFFESNDLFLQDPKKIKRLDVMNREYVLGDRTFPGVVNVTTYKGDLDGIQMSSHATVLDYPGIPEQRQFFSPVYETESQITSRMPDFRTLLFWAPEIKTGENGKKTVSFYSSDLPGKYAVVVQGLSANGEPGSSISYFTVTK